MTSAFHYRGYGLLFASEIELPELAPADPDEADIVISVGPDAAEALATLDNPDSAQYYFAATPMGHVMNLPDNATLLVPDGQRVIVSLVDGSDVEFVRLFLIGSVIGMLFHLRGQLVLHGAAVVHDRGVSVFVGASGAGKSTLAAHMGARGFAILSDDTLPLTQTADGDFMAWPGSRVFKLWRDALDNLGRDVADLQEIQLRTDKFFTPNASIAEDAAHKVVEVFVLQRNEGDDPPKIERLSHLLALQQINEHAYRPEYVGLLGREAPHFHLTAALAGRVKACTLTRPWALERMQETVQLMLDHWGTDASRSGTDPAS